MGSECHVMKKIASLVLLILSLAGACVFLACWLAPKALRHIEQRMMSMRPKYPPLLGESYPEDAAPTEKQKQWALATCAVLTALNQRSHDVLGGQNDDVEGQKDLLRKWWGVNSRKDLLNTLNWVECGGHRKGYDECVRELNLLSSDERGQAKRHAIYEGGAVSNRLYAVLAIHDKFKTAGLAGWDFSRYVSLCGWGFQAGYLTEAEACKQRPEKDGGSDDASRCKRGRTEG